MSPILSRILQLLGLTLIQAALLFASAGSLSWAAGWWYIGLYLTMLVTASLIMIPTRPEVIAERSKGAAGAKPWDVWITRLVAIPALGVLVLSGLDERWGWTLPLPGWLRLAGGLAFAAGYFIVLWAMYTNQFFSQVVRIQTERVHSAITSGPYHFIRHPGYLGMAFSFLGTVFLLDSLWGLACFALYLALLITRTALEDRTLQAELPGYKDYAAHTRYRLIPGVW
jgi:protein-S-isoprenylcysteine O-methyltransferase Ste14